MEIFQATQKGPLKVPGYIDPNEVVTVKVYWGAPVFQTNTVYRAGDICRPTTDNGYYYECTTNGRSDATEPVEWSQETQVSGTVEFTAAPYDLFVLPGEIITSSTWAVSDKADVFVPNAEYAVGDTCRPTTYVGYYYECTIAGNVGPTEPVSWSTTEQVIGSATFAAVAYVDIADATADTVSTTINIASVPKEAVDFILTNHVVKSNGEERDRSFKYKVHEQ
jgi:hypothetical protein